MAQRRWNVEKSEGVPECERNMAASHHNIQQFGHLEMINIKRINDASSSTFK